MRTAELRRRSASEAAARLQGLRELAIDTIHNAIADGDKRTSRWLIDRMNFFDAAAAEDVAQADSAGAEMLENEHILDTVPTMAEVDAAADAVEAADSNFAVAANSAEVTALRNQWDKQETVASSNALSALRSAVTKSPSFPPPGVFADD
ncbi:MAG: hypothetical protein JNN22_14330 [Rhodospirillales bacterium]|nr:hypothetical protein [Rhodospirillales bacterium]